jgi:HEPN domain-containing protein
MNEKFDPTNPQTWLARARSNLRLAEVGHQQGVFLEDLCFEAQQAAEKALKSLWVRHGLDTPRTHSLVILMDGLEPAGLEIPSEVKAADVLTQYAVQARYPDWGEQVTEAEYAHVLELARGVVSWAERVLEGGDR